MSRLIPTRSPARARAGIGHSRRLLAAFALVALGFAVAPPATAATISKQTTIATQVLSLLNQQRAAHHLPALKMNTDLINSAYGHSATMAKADLLSHQCPHEKALGDRITAAHYRWSSAGENIGWTSTMTAAGAKGLETLMYDEKAPNDGHRLNILSTGFRDIGISVITDTAHDRLWLTEDFGHSS